MMRAEIREDGCTIAAAQIEISSQTRLQMRLTRSMIARTSVMPGKIGEMKQVVRMPAAWTACMAARRRSMLTA